MERVGDMTREELKQLVGEVVEERLERLLGENEIRGRQAKETGARAFRRWLEISKKIDRIGWTPPADSPTPLEMLREDRDR